MSEHRLHISVFTSDAAHHQRVYQVMLDGSPLCAETDGMNAALVYAGAVKAQPNIGEGSAPMWDGDTGVWVGDDYPPIVDRKFNRATDNSRLYR